MLVYANVLSYAILQHGISFSCWGSWGTSNCRQYQSRRGDRRH